MSYGSKGPQGQKASSRSPKIHMMISCIFDHPIIDNLVINHIKKLQDVKILIYGYVREIILESYTMQITSSICEPYPLYGIPGKTPT